MNSKCDANPELPECNKFIEKYFFLFQNDFMIKILKYF